MSIYCGFAVNNVFINSSLLYCSYAILSHVSPCFVVYNISLPSIKNRCRCVSSEYAAFFTLGDFVLNFGLHIVQSF